MSFRTYVQFSKVTPQTEQADPRQVPNHAGGFGFQLDPLKQLQRFLILGTTSGTYYQNEQRITSENIESIKVIMKETPLAVEAIDLIVEISTTGRAPKNDPALVALAIAASSENVEVRRYALENLSKVARIPTHLFHFAEYVNGLRGWGRSLREAIAAWYNKKDAGKLSFAMAKYQQRDGWNHKDLLTLSHPVPATKYHNQLYAWAMGREAKTFGLVEGLQKLNKAETETEVLVLIHEYWAPFEVVPTKWLKSPKVWSALLPNLGYTSLIRSLGRMAQNGFLVPGDLDVVGAIYNRIVDLTSITNSKVHPVQILHALRTYSQGHGVKSDAIWPVTREIIEALNLAFYLAFKNVQPTGKKYYIAVDCSGSMSTFQEDIGMSARDGAAVMAMVIDRSENDCIIKGFTSRHSYLNDNAGIERLMINSTMSLEKVSDVMKEFNWGSTDCALPMIDATENKLDVDVFIVITDNETWSGHIHPHQALEKYRRVMNKPDAKLVVMGMTATDISIADPSDPNSLDIVGFDSAVPQLISDFALGKL